MNEANSYLKNNSKTSEIKKILSFKLRGKKFLAKYVGNILNILFPFNEPIVLNYHGILSPDSYLDNDSINNVYFERFKEQINFLLDENYKFLSLAKFIEQYNIGILNSKDCLITVDDVPISFLDGALYLISKKIPFTLFITTSYCDLSNEKWMNWKILKQLEKSNYVSFASHSDKHIPFTKLNPSEIVDNLNASFNKLNKNLSYVSNCIALPYGNYNSRVLNVLTKSAIDLIFLTDAKLSYRKRSNNKAITRIPIGATDNLDIFKSKLKGEYRFF